VTSEQLRAAQRARPFRAFDLHLADGDVLTIPHPDFIALGPGGRTVVAFGENDEMSIVDLLLVSRIEMRKGGSNGGKRK
jgi:hypothetical protein